MSILICSLSFPHTILIGHVQKVNESLTILLIVILTFRRMFSLRDFHRHPALCLQVLLPMLHHLSVSSLLCQQGLCSSSLAGRRVLTEKDFLGPKERERRRNLTYANKESATPTTDQEGEKDYSRYFFAMDQKLLEVRRIDTRKSLYKKRKEAQDAAKNGTF